jgi:GntR family transcriptional repressor for pyruvate dehydrogenase complex
MNRIEKETDNRTTQVVQQLTRAIVGKTYARNTLLPTERDLALQMGVSRNVIREATKVLESRGLLSIRRGVGTIVNGVTSAPVHQVFTDVLDGEENALSKVLEVRLVLELEIAAMAALRRDNEDLHKMRVLLDEFAAHQEDLTRCAEIDLKWHHAVAEATHNPLFVIMLEPLSELLRESRMRALKNSTPSLAHEHHEAIYEAIKQKRPRKAAAAMRHHLETSRQEMQEWLERKHNGPA